VHGREAPAAAPIAPTSRRETVAPAPAVPSGPASVDRLASPRAYGHYLRAREAELRGDWREVGDELRQALAFDPGSAALHVAMAEAWGRSGQLGRAEAEARQALALEPAGATAAEAWLLLGKLALMGRRGPEAAQALRESVRIQSELARGRPADEAALDPDAWRLLAHVEMEAGREPAAALVLDDLAARLPSEGAASLRDLASQLAERGDDARAEGYLRLALERDRHEAEAWRRLAQLLERRRRPDEARKAWEGLLREDPDDAEALLAAGRLALRAGDPAGARAWFGQLEQVSGDESAARAAVAFAWLDARRAADALRVVEDGLRVAPGDPRLRFAEGTVLAEQRRWTEAAEAFAGVTGEDEDLVVSARAGQALALAQGGRATRALSVVDAELRRRPGDPRLVRTRALALERAGRTAEALVVLESAVAARPRDEESRFALAMAHDRTGDRNAAVRVAQGLLELNPDNAEAMNFLAYAWAANGQRLEEAERLASRALDQQPENAAFLDSLGWVHYQRGDYGRAVGLLERAESIGGPEPTILEHLGDAYRRVLRAADAARAYERALEAFDGGAEPETPGQRAHIERKLGELRAADLRPARR